MQHVFEQIVWTLTHLSATGYELVALVWIVVVFGVGAWIAEVLS